MGRTLVEIIPLAIAATFSPTGLLLVMMILSSKDHPRRKALNFIIGSMLFLVILGLGILLIFKTAVDVASHPDRISGFIDIALGVLIVLLITASVLFKKNNKPAREKQRKIPYTIVGFLFMITNASTLIAFIAADKIIADAGLVLLEEILLLTILITITMFMVAFPVVITYAAPNRSQRILGPVKSFISKHGNKIARIYFLLMGVYLVVHGILVIRN